MINIWNNHFYIKESKKQSWKVWNRGGGIGYSRKIVKKIVRQIFEWPLFSIVSSLSPLGRRRSQFNVENGTLYHVGRYFGIFDALDCILLNARPLLRHSPHWVGEGPTFLPCHRSSWDLEDPKRVGLMGKCPLPHSFERTVRLYSSYFGIALF